MDVIAVPLDKPRPGLIPRNHSPVQPLPVRTGCDDAGVIMGDVKKAVLRNCRHDQRWDFGADATPGLEDPDLPFILFEPSGGSRARTGRRHSTVITWDGEAIVVGWARGGCAEAECEATDPDKSMFLNDATAGAKLRHVGPAATAERRRELHDPQLQHGAAPKRPLRGRQRTYEAGMGHSPS